MERTCPSSNFQKRARWLSFITVIVLIGIAAIFPAEENVLAGKRGRIPAVLAGDLVLESVPVELPPSVPPSYAQTASTAQSVSYGQPDPANDPGSYVYTVNAGEYWIGIARGFDLSYKDLRTANPELWSLRREVIRPGDQMIIPGVNAARIAPSPNYTVESGDSWLRIANSFGISFRKLRTDNLLIWNRRGIYIQPGDELFVNSASVPSSEIEGPSSEAEVVIATEIEAIPAESSASSSVTLPSSNVEAPILVGTVPTESGIYTVRPGDTWYGIAAAYGISFARLRSTNPILWSARGQRIRPADQMIVPAHASPLPPPEIKLAPIEETVVPTPDAVEKADVLIEGVSSSDTEP